MKIADKDGELLSNIVADMIKKKYTLTQVANPV